MNDRTDTQHCSQKQAVVSCTTFPDSRKPVVCSNTLLLDLRKCAAVLARLFLASGNGKMFLPDSFAIMEITG
ncbi:MAG TPA: hypothetical protein VHO70_03425 [Chitinispirillaceae bacterium]|nr:hypothetical protein [Chitinispirillaceae bacterium]